jgi:aryl-alcohol dehydrogenase (NADP+)
VLAIADRRGVAPAQVALAWLLAQRAVTSPIVGVTRLEHLADAIAATDLELTAEELEELSSGYVPHTIAGHQ